MATTTNILGLTKPSGEDPVDISVLNNNFQLIDNAFQNFANVIYPVGSIYISTNPTNPATLFQIGTWERIGAGRTLIDCGTGYAANSTGGAATVTLTAAQSGLREHTHTVASSGKITDGITGGSHNHSVTTYADTNSSSTGRRIRGTELANQQKTAEGGTGSSTHKHTLPDHTHTINNVAAANATAAHNNMPPYLAVYMWKRVA